MTHHVDAVNGLLATPKVFYSPRLHVERGAFALEWINAFAHLDPVMRTGLALHGGTLAQLHIGKLQRLSRDIDRLGESRGVVEPVLEAIAARYGHKLFTWSEDTLESPEVPMQRFSVYFPSAISEGALVPLKLDVTYLTVKLPLVAVLLSSSAVYSPLDSANSVETLSPTAFIADKLPTLGFDTLGYSRPNDMAQSGNPEHVFKQLHDIAALTDCDVSYDDLLSLYAAGIKARNAALPGQRRRAGRRELRHRRATRTRGNPTVSRLQPAGHARCVGVGRPRPPPDASLSRRRSGLVASFRYADDDGTISGRWNKGERPQRTRLSRCRVERSRARR